MMLLAPFPWIEVRAVYEAAKTTWLVTQSDRRDAFNRNVPDYVDQTTISAAIKFVF